MQRAEWAFLGELEQQLAARRDPVVAVVAGRASVLDKAVAEVFPAARVSRIDNRADASAMHVTLAAGGPYDVLVDDVHARGNPVRRFRRLFGHVRAGGVLVVRVGDQRLREYLARLRSDPEALLARSMGSVVLDQRHVLVENRLLYLAKLREHEMNMLIDVRGRTDDRVIDLLPPMEFRSRCRLRENDAHHNDRMLETYQVPEITLREYTDVTCLPGQVVTKGNLLLPDSFRHNQSARLRNLYTEGHSTLFARPKADGSGAETLAGPHYYLDSEFRGHFGHAMTEVMSRLWAWSAAKRAEPRLKALMTVNKGRLLGDFEIALFKAAGIDPDDLVLVPGPVRVERLVAATPMFSMPEYVHPRIQETWGRVGRALAAEGPTGDYPERIFCGRRRAKRPCRNTAEIESHFSRHRFAIVYPEDFSLAEQARMFRHAQVVAGYAGSALFTSALCDTPKHLVIICSETYTATNDYMIASVLGHEIDVVWCPSVAELPESGPPRFNAEFFLDFDRDGGWLRRILESL